MKLTTFKEQLNILLRKYNIKCTFSAPYKNHSYLFEFDNGEMQEVTKGIVKCCSFQAKSLIINRLTWE